MHYFEYHCDEITSNDDLIEFWYFTSINTHHRFTENYRIILMKLNWSGFYFDCELNFFLT